MIHLQSKRCLVAKIESNSAEILSKFRFDSNLKEIIFVEDTVVLAGEPGRCVNSNTHHLFSPLDQTSNSESSKTLNHIIVENRLNKAIYASLTML